jgi:hypothetical protein
MARNRNCEYGFSSKACDVEYRTRRLVDMAVRSQNTLASIDPAGTDAEAHARATLLVAELLGFVERMADARPPKRAYVKGGKPKPEPKKRGRKPKARPEAQEPDLLDPTEATPTPSLTSLDELLDAAE